MNHNDWMEKTLALGTGTLSEKDQRAAASHLADCADCRRDVALLRRLETQWGGAPAVPSEEFVQRLMARVQLEPPPTRGGLGAFLEQLFPGRAGGRWVLAGAGAATLAALLFWPSAVPPAPVSMGSVAADYPVPFDEVTSAGFGTAIEEYLL